MPGREDGLSSKMNQPSHTIAKRTSKKNVYDWKTFSIKYSFRNYSISSTAYLIRSSNIIDQYDSNMCTKNALKYHNNHMKSYEIIWNHIEKLQIPLSTTCFPQRPKDFPSTSTPQPLAASRSEGGLSEVRGDSKGVGWWELMRLPGGHGGHGGPEKARGRCGNGREWIQKMRDFSTHQSWGWDVYIEYPMIYSRVFFSTIHARWFHAKRWFGLVGFLKHQQ